MNKYKVGIFEEQAGYVVIEAKNKAEAEEIAQKGLETEGINFFKDFDITHREMYIVDKPEKI